MCVNTNALLQSVSTLPLAAYGFLCFFFIWSPWVVNYLCHQYNGLQECYASIYITKKPFNIINIYSKCCIKVIYTCLEWAAAFALGAYWFSKYLFGKRIRFVRLFRHFCKWHRIVVMVAQLVNHSCAAARAAGVAQILKLSCRQVI